MDKVVGLYNEHHLAYLYDWMVKNGEESVIDITGQAWYKKNLKQILVQITGLKR